MFIFLVSIGIIFIFLGLYNEKIRKDNPIDVKLEERLSSQEIDDLKDRVEYLEKLMLYEGEAHESSKPTDEAVLEDDEVHIHKETQFSKDLEKANGFLQKYKLICQYEADNLSVEEICSKLNMKKGEILLLKNLYKNY